LCNLNVSLKLERELEHEVYDGDEGSSLQGMAELMVILCVFKIFK